MVTWQPASLLDISLPCSFSSGLIISLYDNIINVQCRDWLEIPKERVFVNDPIFFCGEIELLKLLDLEVVSENIECNLKCQVHILTSSTLTTWESYFPI